VSLAGRQVGLDRRFVDLNRAVAFLALVRRCSTGDDPADLGAGQVFFTRNLTPHQICFGPRLGRAASVSGGTWASAANETRIVSIRAANFVD